MLGLAEYFVPHRHGSYGALPHSALYCRSQARIMKATPEELLALCLHHDIMLRYKFSVCLE